MKLGKTVRSQAPLSQIVTTFSVFSKSATSKFGINPRPFGDIPAVDNRFFVTLSTRSRTLAHALARASAAASWHRSGGQKNSNVQETDLFAVAVVEYYAVHNNTTLPIVIPLFASCFMHLFSFTIVAFLLLSSVMKLHPAGSDYEGYRVSQ